jgi:hypothetical protein
MEPISAIGKDKLVLVVSEGYEFRQVHATTVDPVGAASNDQLVLTVMLS